MLLPRLEEVVVVSKPSRIGNFRPNTPKLKFPTGKTSSIRKLKLIDCSFFEGEVEALAKFTGSLTSLNHALCGFRRKEIVDWFLRANSSLTQDRITSIFTPRPKYEEDLGPVDKDKYYKFRYDYLDTDAYNESVGSSSSEGEW
ncbi:hypothetical protein TWF225_006406 [Orbilia oligospora]|nr:hypothetical protein TWF225_006406 [Orbilia oligospora]KAF3241157.1 hypothetical protein TWF128_011129 [Orbilia oligospora]